MLIMVLISLSNTPPVESGPAATAACILKCCGGVCYGASFVCLPMGSVTGPLGIFAASGCLLGAGGGCAACTAGCLGLISLPTP